MKRMMLFGIPLAIIMLLIGMMLHAIFKPTTLETPPTKLDETELQNLRDTIVELRANIEYYNGEIERLSQEKEKFKNELQQIVKANEAEIKNIIDGDVAYNAKFLSDYLSKSDSMEY